MDSRIYCNHFNLRALNLLPTDARVRHEKGEGGDYYILTLGHPVLDRYLSFVGARARRNTHLAVAYDLKVFFSFVRKEPAAVISADLFAFIEDQRTPRRGGKVLRLTDGSGGLAISTIKRRLSSVSGLYEYLIATGEYESAKNPVPRSLSSRPRRDRRSGSGPALLRAPHRLPRVLSPDEVNAFIGALRRYRDRAMVSAMLLGGLRRSEVLSLRCRDVNIGERRLFIAGGKGGKDRIVPVSPGFHIELDRYLAEERPQHILTDYLFVVLKGPHRGQPLTAAGLGEIVSGARERAGLSGLTCHQLRHTCFTRLREAGMPIEAIQAQAGHRSIETTKVYLHLSARWLADEYLRAVAAIDQDGSSMS